MPRRTPKRHKRTKASKAAPRGAAGLRANWLSAIAMPKVSKEFIARSLIGVAWIVGAGGILAGWTWGVPHLRQYATSRLEPRQIEIRLIDAPVWLSGAPLAIDRIKAAVAQQVGVDPFDRGGLLQATDALERTGWFESIDSITRATPEVIEVRGQYVKPFTTIRDGGGSHLVTETGNLLPVSYPRDARLKALPAITNPRFARPAQTGDHWDGTDVAAGLRLVALLEGRPWLHQVVEVDVSKYTTEETLWLVTDKGGRIRWGRAPGDERGREVPAEQKLSYLDFMYKEFRRVDRDLKELVLMPDYVYAPQ